MRFELQRADSMTRVQGLTAARTEVRSGTIPRHFAKVSAPAIRFTLNGWRLWDAPAYSAACSLVKPAATTWRSLS